MNININIDIDINNYNINTGNITINGATDATVININQ